MKKVYLLLLLCCLCFTGFATTWYSAPAGGDPSVLTNWWDSPAGTGANPANFTTAADIFIVQSNMLMTANTWTVDGAVTMNSGYIWNNRTGGGFGGSPITLNFHGTLTMNNNASIDGNPAVSGGLITVNLYSDLYMSGTSFFNNQSTSGSALTDVNFANNASTFASPQHLSGIGSQAGSNYTTFTINNGVHVQLVDNFNTETYAVTGGFGGINNTFNVGGGFGGGGSATLDCQTYNFNGPGGVIVNNGATLYTANAAGINGSITCTGTNTMSSSANYIFNGTVPQVTGSLLPATFTVSGGGGGGSTGTMTVNNTAGVTLSQSTTFSNSGGGGGGTSLTLTSGTLTLGASNLTMGSNATLAGAFSSTAMIVENGAGQLRKQFSANAAFTYPVGDNSGNYTPISINMTATTYGGGAYAGVTVNNMTDPHNANTNNYLNRYWNIALSAITSPSYTITSAKYVAGDVVGTESLISAGKYPSALPWVKYGPANTVTHSLSSTAITNANVDFGGITTASPTLTITPSASVCSGSPTVLSVLTETADGTPTYSWSPSSGLSTTVGSSVTATPTVTTTYTGTITDGNGFTGTATTTLTVNPAPSPLTTSSGSATLCLGQSLTLSDAVTGGTWSSTNTASASVDGSGNVFADAAGSASIIYTVAGGCNVSFPIFVVTSADPIAGTPVVCEGATTPLSETGSGTWTSSNTALATVDPTSGVVSGVLSGNPDITYTLAPGCTATTTVTVNAVPSPIGGAASTCAGTTTALSESTSGGAWSSSNTSEAVVSPAGVVTGLTGGTPNIIYTIPTGCNTSVAVPIVLPPPAISGAASVCAGLSATLTDAASGGTWMSGNTALATVNPVTGVVHGIFPGTPTISYFVVPGCITSIPLVVNPGGTPTVGIAVTPGGTLCPGSTAHFTTTSSAFGGASPTYKWVKNGIYVATGASYSFVPADGDVVYNVMHSTFACASIDSAISGHVTMAITPVVTPVVTISAVSTTAGKGENDTLIAIVTSATPTPGYQWYKGGAIIAGATSSYYIINQDVTGTATYNCIVSSGGACNVTGVSNGLAITVSDVSVKQLASAGSELKLAPNPNKGIFTMNLLSENNEQVRIVITNILGEQVKEFTATTNTDTEISLNAAAGIYLLSANTEHGRYVARVVVN